MRSTRGFVQQRDELPKLRPGRAPESRKRSPRSDPECLPRWRSCPASVRLSRAPGCRTRHPGGRRGPGGRGRIPPRRLSRRSPGHPATPAGRMTFGRVGRLRRLGHVAPSDDGTSAFAVQRPKAALSTGCILRNRISGGELDGGEAAVLALHAGDEALAGGETEEDRTDEQGYRRDREPARQGSSLGSPARFRRPGSTSRPW